MKIWIEKTKMLNLITDLNDLKLETFDGEWEEHDLLDGWMLEILASGLMDNDVGMVGAEVMGNTVERMLVDDDDMDSDIAGVNPAGG